MCIHTIRHRYLEHVLYFIQVTVISSYSDELIFGQILTKNGICRYSQYVKSSKTKTSILDVSVLIVRYGILLAVSICLDKNITYLFLKKASLLLFICAESGDTAKILNKTNLKSLYGAA